MLTAEQKLKWLILLKARELGYDDLDDCEITEGNIDELCDEADGNDSWSDAKSEIRSGQYETTILPESSRHYESKSVAAQFVDGSWIGWTYWYGGGKHGEPEAIDWINEAYDLEVKEEEKMVIVREWKKV